MEFVALETIAETAVALAGFAAVAGAIQRTMHDSESIFGVVLHGIVALAFSLLGLRLGGSHEGVRIIAGVWVLVAATISARNIWMLLLSWGEGDHDRASQFFGMSAFVSGSLTPVFPLLLVFDIYPGHAALLYELGLLLHLLCAALLFLFVMWRHLARRAPKRSAAE